MEQNVVEPVEDNAPVTPVGNLRSSTEREYELYYREVRRIEMLDDLAIRVLNLPDSAHSLTLNKLAAKHLEKRFS